MVAVQPPGHVWHTRLRCRRSCRQVSSGIVLWRPAVANPPHRVLALPSPQAVVDGLPATSASAPATAGDERFDTHEDLYNAIEEEYWRIVETSADTVQARQLARVGRLPSRLASA